MISLINGKYQEAAQYLGGLIFKKQYRHEKRYN